MDVLLVLGEVDSLTIINTSFLCGSSVLGSTCYQCHPSCTSCNSEAGICDFCASAGATQVTDGAMCLCNSETGGIGMYHSSCGACHPSCTTCGLSNSESKCHTCALGHTTLAPYNAIGYCQCRDGFVPDNFPTAACIPCAPAGCPICIGSDESQCMSQEQADFATSLLIGELRLPLLTESADNLICYRTPLPTAGCTPDPIESVTGTIIDYETVAKPTDIQCFNLLTAEWPFVTYWFDQLFPTFTGPVPNTHFYMAYLKTALQIWILHFGPAEMNTWTDIKEAMNDAGENWKNHMAWIDSSPGFSLDAGTTVKAFPAKLLAWLQSKCSVTPACMELWATFNLSSSVCYGNSIPLDAQAYCSQIISEG